MTEIDGMHSLLRDLVDDLRNEERESDRTIHLTPNENVLSRLARSFLSTSLGYRYHLDVPSSRHVDGRSAHVHGLTMNNLSAVGNAEERAVEAARRLFGAQVSDLRLLSGVHATVATLASVTEPGDLVYSIDPGDGGHFATRHILQRLGRRSKYFGWNDRELTIDLDSAATDFAVQPPDAVVFDHGAPLFALPASRIREFSPPGAIIVYDASHTLGLIAGLHFQQPFLEGCDIIQGNLHKSFPGPQKAAVNFRDSALGKEVSNSFTAGLVSSQHTHEAIAAYITLLEMEVFARDYGVQMLANAQELGWQLKRSGFDLVERGGRATDSHQLLVAAPTRRWASDAVRALSTCGVSVNARSLYGRPVLRLGVQEVTRRGMQEDEMATLAAIFEGILKTGRAPADSRRDIESLGARFPNVSFSFDRQFGLWE